MHALLRSFIEAEQERRRSLGKYERLAEAANDARIYAEQARKAHIKAESDAAEAHANWFTAGCPI